MLKINEIKRQIYRNLLLYEHCKLQCQAMSSAVTQISKLSATDSVIDVSAIDLKTIKKRMLLLSKSEKKELLLQLQLEESKEKKKIAEAKLASWRWRSKFGRPAKMHSSQVDPTGTYCEIPQSWHEEKVVAIFNALPFIGFGFLDNFIMIMAGDYIDLTLGATLGISTLAAAALGNTISDLAGMGSAWYVENLSVKFGVTSPDLTQEQLEMASSRWSSNIGRTIGIVIGCLLGMVPLLFLSHKEEENKQIPDSKSEEKK